MDADMLSLLVSQASDDSDSAQLTSPTGDAVDTTQSHHRGDVSFSQLMDASVFSFTAGIDGDTALISADNNAGSCLEAAIDGCPAATRHSAAADIIMQAELLYGSVVQAELENMLKQPEALPRPLPTSYLLSLTETIAEGEYMHSERYHIEKATSLLLVSYDSLEQPAKRGRQECTPEDMVTRLLEIGPNVSVSKRTKLAKTAREGINRWLSLISATTKDDRSILTAALSAAPEKSNCLFPSPLASSPPHSSPSRRSPLLPSSSSLRPARTRPRCQRSADHVSAHATEGAPDLQPTDMEKRDRLPHGRGAGNSHITRNGDILETLRCSYDSDEGQVVLRFMLMHSGFGCVGLAAYGICERSRVEAAAEAELSHLLSRCLSCALSADDSRSIISLLAVSCSPFSDIVGAVPSTCANYPISADAQHAAALLHLVLTPGFIAAYNHVALSEGGVSRRRWQQIIEMLFKHPIIVAALQSALDSQYNTDDDHDLLALIEILTSDVSRDVVLALAMDAEERERKAHMSAVRKRDAYHELSSVSARRGSPLRIRTPSRCDPLPCFPVKVFVRCLRDMESEVGATLLKLQKKFSLTPVDVAAIYTAIQSHPCISWCRGSSDAPQSECRNFANRKKWIRLAHPDFKHYDGAGWPAYVPLVCDSRPVGADERVAVVEAQPAPFSYGSRGYVSCEWGEPLNSVLVWSRAFTDDTKDESIGLELPEDVVATFVPYVEEDVIRELMQMITAADSKKQAPFTADAYTQCLLSSLFIIWLADAIVSDAEVQKIAEPASSAQHDARRRRYERRSLGAADGALTAGRLASTLASPVDLPIAPGMWLRWSISGTSADHNVGMVIDVSGTEVQCIRQDWELKTLDDPALFVQVATTEDGGVLTWFPSEASCISFEEIEGHGCWSPLTVLGSGARSGDRPDFMPVIPTHAVEELLRAADDRREKFRRQDRQTILMDYLGALGPDASLHDVTRWIEQVYGAHDYRDDCRHWLGEHPDGLASALLCRLIGANTFNDADADGRPAAKRSRRR